MEIELTINVKPATFPPFGIAGFVYGIKIILFFPLGGGTPLPPPDRLSPLAPSLGASGDFLYKKSFY
ncbi:hypothetical protein A2641_01750 [Candidatus Nomurabacteria bacterium RIFCSPHIGHO2_01_FULL_37_25]|uniref:Uncharacterized protein n=1 Tax=Candidatus Nomurabacteria bacterium RIFCSPLOWO2_01_FULL_36_16 TaxID=1801767 RepID=A0A1F6WXS8_9BACT|nr:MAG: hypothetical protein A2641_01750 [Candidatus Nomurabacteria bacterium RIFCSPHIGHO2_01_FULL_37_25]OGI74995.1 MAG: hypothetical protein A3D36_00630 [Candidatus Nomurabacteria bacterium RIFCSPHIGHO2_02_FULL_36_29]OGI86701.1 MAG: hypothetical protein A3A91_03655 [Candidatus Nomurabacteria bacterium RIFCSPLOWO2_01_FULL_36_16]